MQYYVSSKINRNTNLSIILSYPQLILYTRINPTYRTNNLRIKKSRSSVESETKLNHKNSKRPRLNTTRLSSLIFHPSSVTRPKKSLVKPSCTSHICINQCCINRALERRPPPLPSPPSPVIIIHADAKICPRGSVPFTPCTQLSGDRLARSSCAFDTVKRTRLVPHGRERRRK